MVKILKDHDPELAKALEKIKIYNTSGGNGNDKEQVVKYFKPKKTDLEDGLIAAEAQMRAEQGDVIVDNHPFFKEMKDPTKKEAFFAKVDKGFDDEVEKNTIRNKKNGIKTEKDW